jgi:hypothetical protein
MNPFKRSIISFTFILLQLGKHLEHDKKYTTNPQKQEIPSTKFATSSPQTPRYLDMYLTISKFGKKKNWNIHIPSKSKISENNNLLKVILLLAEDVELNPGPTCRSRTTGMNDLQMSSSYHTCGMCSKFVRKTEKAKQRNDCGKWIHLRLQNVCTVAKQYGQMVLSKLYITLWSML